jgi:hypothetical protein
MPLSQTITRQFIWVWLIPAAALAAAALTRVEALIAVGIGFAAALPLSGSI